MDYFVCLIVDFFVFLSRWSPSLSKYGLCKFDRWRKGEKLKILLVGYNGKKNTGADVRVAEMVKEFQNNLDPNSFELRILTFSEKDLQIYFTYVGSNVKLLHISTIYFVDLFIACNQAHMVVLSEGSTLKSKFSNVLTLFFCQAAGMMKQQNKACIAFGSEAGHMDDFVINSVKKHCDNTYFIARTLESLNVIQNLKLKGELGTDTAWLFDSSSKNEWAVDYLKNGGWNGKQPLVGIAVINPFCWPVKACFLKFVNSLLTSKWENHYEKWYYFTWNYQRDKKFKYYMDAIANAVNRFLLDQDTHVIIFGMEKLDLDACQLLKQKINKQTQIVTSSAFDGYEITALLRRMDYLITSRYHARVLSFDANVPAIAVSMDERLENIFRECGFYENLYYKVDEMGLEDKIYYSLKLIKNDRKIIQDKIEIKKEYYKSAIVNMNKTFKDFILKNFKGIKI